MKNPKIFICMCAGIIIICVFAVLLSVTWFDVIWVNYDCLDNFQGNENKTESINEIEKNQQNKLPSSELKQNELKQSEIQQSEVQKSDNDEVQKNENNPLMSYRYREGDTDMDDELIQSGLTVDIYGKKTYHRDAIVPMGVATMMDYSRRFIDDQFDATHIPLVNYLHRC
jgi:hypothetical protein